MVVVAHGFEPENVRNGPRRADLSIAKRETSTREPVSEETNSRYRVEQFHTRHVAGASKILLQAFPDNILMALGHGFVQQFLTSYITTPGGFGYVCIRGDELAGVVIGAGDAGQHRSKIIRRCWLPLLLQGLLRLVTSPRLAVRFLRYLRACLPVSSLTSQVKSQRAGRVEVESIPPASLVLIGVAPECRRRGIAKHLMQAFLDELARQGAERVKLVVGAENEPALSFYLSHGWRIAGRYPTPEGGFAYRLVYDLVSRDHRLKEVQRGSG